MQEIFSNTDYVKFILAIFYKQKDQDTTITEITRFLYKPKENINITKTAEYNRVMRILQVLEGNKIIQKVKPEKKDKFKTHYIIDVPNFTKLILSYLQELPLYSFGGMELFKGKKYWSNHLIQSYITMFYVGLSHKFFLYLLSDNEYFRDLILNFSLSESVFLFINKSHSRVMPDLQIDDDNNKDEENNNQMSNVELENEMFEEGEINLEDNTFEVSLEEVEKEAKKRGDTLSYYQAQYQKYIKKSKDSTKNNFFLFLLSLKIVEHYYLPFSYANGLRMISIKSLRDYQKME